MGRRVDQVPENYTRENFLAWTDRSRANLGVDTLDLVQLHCPPTPVYSTDAVFDALDGLVEAGAVAAHGGSGERGGEGVAAVAPPDVATAQIILQPLPLEPLDPGLP